MSTAVTEMQMKLRRRAFPIWTRVMQVAHRGTGMECPCCEGEFKNFSTAGHPPRPNSLCPRCTSRERHRLLALALRTDYPKLRGRLLHFAPERALDPVMRRIATEYVTTDILEGADVQADITELPFPDDRWDIIVCSHLLEHVPDDASAIRELRRVLAPGGVAFVVVPRVTGQPTDEDLSVTDPQERKKRYGQVDHVRLYGDDFESRITAGGFDAAKAITPDDFSPEQQRRHALLTVGGGSDEITLACRSSG